MKDLYEKEKLLNDRLRLEKERLTKDAQEHARILQRTEQKYTEALADAREVQRSTANSL